MCGKKCRVEIHTLEVEWEWGYGRFIVETGRESWWGLSRREREREGGLGLSGLQGPKHYWRWQFCPAARTDSCGDSQRRGLFWVHSCTLHSNERREKALESPSMDSVTRLMMGHSQFPTCPSSPASPRPNPTQISNLPMVIVIIYFSYSLIFLNRFKLMGGVSSLSRSQIWLFLCLVLFVSMFKPCS